MPPKARFEDIIETFKFDQLEQNKRVQGSLATNLNITVTLTLEKSLKKLDLFQSTWDATWDAVAYSWGHHSQFLVEIGAVYNGFCKPQSCQKQKDNYSTE